MTLHKNQALTFIAKLPQYTDYNCSSQMNRPRLPQNLLHSASDKVQGHSCFDLQIAHYNFYHCFFIPFLQKWQSILNIDCIDCQMPKYKNMEQNKAAILPF